jgi:hypothetical protein
LEQAITKKGWWSGSRCRSWVQTPVTQKTTTTIITYLFFVLFCLSGAGVWTQDSTC